jgi:carbon monoxide dehydrogenase subunit G
MSIKISRSVVKSVDIKASKSKVFAFLADPMNWPQWVVVNLKSIEQAGEGLFKMTTKHGVGNLKMHLNEKLGIFDHTWSDSQASWTVPARVVSNGEGATVMITVFQPQNMNATQFDITMKEMDIEMAKLKEILDGRS